MCLLCIPCWMHVEARSAFVENCWLILFYLFSYRQFKDLEYYLFLLNGFLEQKNLMIHNAENRRLLCKKRLASQAE